MDRLGAIIECGPICDRCTAAVLYAIRSLPVDIRDLSRLLPPSLSPKMRDPELPEQPRIKNAPPLPMQAAVWSTMELMIYESGVWAEAVADTAGLEWDSHNFEHMLWPRRAETAAAMLEAGLEQLLNLRDVEHRARSVHADAHVGHDEDRTIVSVGDVWTTRHGWQGALTLLTLHQAVQRFCGRHPGNRIPLPCSRCHQKKLVREQHNNRIICRFCGDTESDDDFAAFMNAALHAVGKPRHDAYGPDPDEPEPVPVGRGGTPNTYPDPGLPLHGPFLPDAECWLTELPVGMCGCHHHRGDAA